MPRALALALLVLAACAAPPAASPTRSAPAGAGASRAPTQLAPSGPPSAVASAAPTATLAARAPASSPRPAETATAPPAGPSTSAAPAALGPLTISGTVRSRASGSALRGATVSALAAATGALVATGSTDASGGFVLAVGPGAYAVRFEPPALSAYAPQYWNGAPDAAAAAAVILSTASVSGIDAALESGYVVSGVVRGRGVGALRGVSVEAYRADTKECCALVRRALTDRTGTYVLVLVPGSYRLAFAPAASSGYAMAWWEGAPAFDLASDLVLEASTRLDAWLEFGYAITGKVTDFVGVPIANTSVAAYLGGTGSTTPTPLGISGHPVLSDATGRYAVIIPNGTYRLVFTPPMTSGARAIWWRDAASFGGALDIPVSGQGVGVDTVLPKAP